MKFIRFFNNINKQDVSLAGGKGASLGEMYNSNIPVPNGFVILSSTFDKFLKDTKLNKEIDLILKKVNLNNQKTITQASKRIQSLILSKPLLKDLESEILLSFKKLNTKFVAVRSSATSEDSVDDAWAGQLNTYLNTTNNTLFTNIKNCWASLFTERAIFYRFEKGLKNKFISVAVVVQKMVDSEKSGIAFSVHPVLEDPNQLIIEAGFGLGEAIVSGQVTPNSYIVSKKPHNILNKTISEQTRELVKSNKGVSWKNIEKKRANSQVLTDKEILSLSTLIQRIENHYGFPVDVEWAIEKNKIYITQSRPITTLKNKKKEIKPKIELQKLFTRERNLFSNYLEYSANYSGDKSLIGCALTNFLYLNKSGLTTFWYDVNKITEIGRLVLSKAEDKSFFKLIFFNFDKFWKKTKNYLKGTKQIKSISELHEFYVNYFIYQQYNAIIRVILEHVPESKLPKEYNKIAFKYRKETQEYINNLNNVFIKFFNKNYPEYNEIAEYLLPEEVFSLEKRKFTSTEINKFKNRKEKGYILFNDKLFSLLELKDVLNKNNFIINVDEYKIELHREHSREYSLSRMYAWYRSFSYYFTKINLVSKGLEHTTFIYTGKDLVDVYYDNRELLDVFKIIETNANKSFKSVENCISEFLELFEILKPYFNKTKRIETIDEYKKVLEYYGSYWAKIAVAFVLPEPNFKVSEKIKKITLDARTKTQEYNEALEPVISDFIERKYPYLKGNTRFVLPQDIFNNDINNKTEMLEKIEERKKGFVYYQGKLYTEDINETLHKLNLCLEKQETKVQEIKGQIGYKGKVQGIVRIITSQKQISDFIDGEVMVSAMTMPNYLPAMKKASAFVTDEGGITCHAAIVSRELKKPCVIGTKIATEVLKTGDLVEVDADNGVVRLLNNVTNKKSEYIRFVRYPNMSYLISDIAFDSYINLKPLFVFKDNYLTYYLTTESIDFANQEIFDLLSNNKFKDYLSKFEKEINTSANNIKTIISKKKISKLDVTSFFQNIIKLISIYRYTEHYYTDKAYQASNTNSKLKINLDNFGKFKNKTRHIAGKVLLSDNSYVLTLLNKLSKQSKVDVNTLLSYSTSDLISLFDNKIVDLSEIKKRKDSYLFILDNSKQTFTGNKEVNSFLKNISIKNESTSNSEIKGISVNKGYAKGKARKYVEIIGNYEKSITKYIKSIKPGDIVVAETTIPALLPALKKAGGIVTAEGGLLSHAAIISRELNKPCIVGISSNIDLIKENDMLEVDANKGIVKILNKKESK